MKSFGKAWVIMVALSLASSVALACPDEPVTFQVKGCDCSLQDLSFSIKPEIQKPSEDFSYRTFQLQYQQKQEPAHTWQLNFDKNRWCLQGETPAVCLEPPRRKSAKKFQSADILDGKGKELGMIRSIVPGDETNPGSEKKPPSLLIVSEKGDFEIEIQPQFQPASPIELRQVQCIQAPCPQLKKRHPEGNDGYLIITRKGKAEIARFDTVYKRGSAEEQPVDKAGSTYDLGVRGKDYQKRGCKVSSSF